MYKPMYSVSLNDEFIGYTEDKSKLQKKLNSYLTSGDNNTVAFVDVVDLPKYNLCLLKKGLTANDDEIFAKVVESGITYYKYYAISEENEEKYYVQTYQEAESIVQELKTKNSQNQDKVTYTLKYATELKDFTDQSTAVAALYKEMPIVVKKAKKPATGKNIDTSASPLEVALIEPVGGTITSRFGARSRGTHTGLDIATSSGTPIKAAATGVVTYAGWKGSYGQLVVIEHTNSTSTYYAHCSRIYVNVGQQVNQGDVIAAVGSTGNSTGPHLHLEIRVNDKPRNPQNYLYRR